MRKKLLELQGDGYIFKSIRFKLYSFRFGDMLPKSNKVGGAPSPDLDVLKKRAERFGTVRSYKM